MQKIGPNGDGQSAVATLDGRGRKKKKLRVYLLLEDELIGPRLGVSLDKVFHLRQVLLLKFLELLRRETMQDNTSRRKHSKCAPGG